MNKKTKKQTNKVKDYVNYKAILGILAHCRRGNSRRNKFSVWSDVTFPPRD